MTDSIDTLAAKASALAQAIAFTGEPMRAELDALTGMMAAQQVTYAESDFDADLREVKRYITEEITHVVGVVSVERIRHTPVLAEFRIVLTQNVLVAELFGKLIRSGLYPCGEWRKQWDNVVLVQIFTKGV